MYDERQICLWVKVEGCRPRLNALPEYYYSLSRNILEGANRTFCALGHGCIEVDCLHFMNIITYLQTLGVTRSKPGPLRQPTQPRQLSERLDAKKV